MLPGMMPAMMLGMPVLKVDVLCVMMTHTSYILQGMMPGLMLGMPVMIVDLLNVMMTH